MLDTLLIEIIELNHQHDELVAIYVIDTVFIYLMKTEHLKQNDKKRD